jgi:hypothetical protein
MHNHPTDSNSDRQHNSGNKPTINDYQRWLERRSDTGNFFIFFRDHLSIMSTESAIVFQSLVNLGRNKDRDGWILCTSAYLESQLFMTKRVIDRVMRELKEKNFIEVEVRGFERLRHIRLNLSHLERCLDEVQAERLPKHQNVPLHSTETYHNKSIPTEYSNKSNKHCRRTNSAATPPRGDADGEEGTTTFPIQVPGQDKSRPPRRSRGPLFGIETPSPSACGYAARLAELVIKAGKRHRRSSQRDWERAFTKAEQTYSASTVETVFNWYAKHFGERFVPEIESGKTFYTRFEAIQKAIKRDERDNPQVTVSPQAAKLAKRFDNWGWPKGSETQLPTVVQVSIDRIEELVTKLNGVYSVRQSPVENRLVLEVIRQTADVNWLLTEWFRDVHRRVANWAAWSGDLMPFAFDFNSKQFRAMAQDWSRKKCGDPTVWDKILKEILK